MTVVRLLLLSICLAICYYALSIAAIGAAAAGKIFWWFQWQDNLHFYHIAQNFIGIGLAALLPAYLVHSYESDNKWLCIGLVIVLSMSLHGNIHYVPWDPVGIVRFFNDTLLRGDAGSVGIFLEILFMPILWLLAFERMPNRVMPRKFVH